MIRDSLGPVRMALPGTAMLRLRAADSSSRIEVAQALVPEAPSRAVPLTPEPISMTLLALGLVGVTAIGRIRRPGRGPTR